MAVCDYEYDQDTGKLRVNCLGCMFGASIEDYDTCMARVIDKIMEVKKVSSIVLAKEREYEYDQEQTSLLVDIARIIEEIVRERVISPAGMGKECERHFPKWSARLQFLVINLLRRDPIGAYAELLRDIRKVNIAIRRARTRREQDCLKKYKENMLLALKEKLEKAKLIGMAKPHIAGYHLGDRELYRQIFSPSVRPNFMLTRYMITPPEMARSLERYRIGDVTVEIFRVPDSTEHLYYIIPPEFRLSEEKYTVLDAARRYMAAHRPKTAEFVKSERVREVFYNIGRDMIREMADNLGVHLTTPELQQLAQILTRYTAGLGVLELLMGDERIQDIYINSPIERSPIRIFHQDYEECSTNLIPTREDAESWATRLRIQSGRPLDEANPVLDTDLGIPGGRARFCVITRTLSPQGLGFAIRRHRDKPWTLPLFIKAKMLDPLAAGLFSFLVDGAASVLIAGGRSSGKTSLLASLMLEMLPQTRQVLLEDSVTGDSQIIYQNSGELKIGTVEDIIDPLVEKYGRNEYGRDIANQNPKNIKVFAMDENGKVVPALVSKFVRHKTNKRIFNVKISTGRKITVTEDHSLFSLSDEGEIIPVKASQLRPGDYIVSPRVLRFKNRGLFHINLLRHLGKIGNVYIMGEEIKRFLIENWKPCKRLAKEAGYSRSMAGLWKKRGLIPARIMKKLLNMGYKFDSRKLKIKTHKSIPIPALIKFDRDFLTFIGLWLADGCYDSHSVIVSTGEEEEREVFRSVAKKFGFKTKRHSDGFALMLNSTMLKRVMRDILGLKGSAYTKRIPPWVYKLSKKQTGYVLKGIFSGDGCVSDKEIVMSLSSKGLLNDLQTLLLAYGIILRIGKFKESDKTWRSGISSIKFLKLFKRNMGFLQKRKLKRLELLCSRKSTHDTSDIVPIPLQLKKKISECCKIFNRHDYIKRDNKMGREHLKKLIKHIDPKEKELISRLSILANSDILWDRITEMKSRKGSGYVYDFSVPGYENFICNNILAHNTLELPVDSLRELKFNIQRLKSRSVITMIETEMAADEALRTALRLGDSALIVGEIRSKEAKALWEAMRIGALSNVVAGTIHGESPYGVYDRVVNDLGVPPTSFKATDIIPICKMLRSADGLHRFRRMTEVTEIRKEWEENPVKEGGFVPLMVYSAREDKLKPTDTLVNGESEVLNRMASYVKEWAGNWDALWENIKLRARIKQVIVDISDKAGKPDLLEAEWVTKSNSQYHLIAEEVRKETGGLDPERVYKEWLKWFKLAAKIG